MAKSLGTQAATMMFKSLTFCTASFLDSVAFPHPPRPAYHATGLSRRLQGQDRHGVFVIPKPAIPKHPNSRPFFLNSEVPAFSTGTLPQSKQTGINGYES